MKCNEKLRISYVVSKWLEEKPWYLKRQEWESTRTHTQVMKKDATKEHNNQDSTNTLIIICQKLACNSWCATHKAQKKTPPKNITQSGHY
jgi:hypothetical protein